MDAAGAGLAAGVGERLPYAGADPYAGGYVEALGAGDAGGTPLTYATPSASNITTKDFMAYR